MNDPCILYLSHVPVHVVNYSPLNRAPFELHQCRLIMTLTTGCDHCCCSFSPFLPILSHFYSQDMENIPHELSASLEGLLSLLSNGIPSETAFTQDSTISSTIAPTVSSTSSTSVSGFQIRRATRRLDRALRALETALEEFQERDEIMSLGPLLQSDLVDILTKLAQAFAAHPTMESRNQDVLELYQDIVVTACRILTMNPHAPVLPQPQQLDALVDQIALLLMQQQQSRDDRVLNALVACVNSHLIYVECNSHEDPVLFPLLKGMETIQLCKMVLAKCSQDMGRWNPHQDDDNGRFALWSFCTFLLKHLATCRGEHDTQGWLQNCFMEDQEQASARGMSQNVNAFLDSCRAFGVDLIEVCLDILDQATIETAIADHAHTAIQHASLVYTTVYALENGLDIALSFSILKAFFTTYASFVAVLSHKQVEQEEIETKTVACDLLLELANFVLKNPQSRSAGLCDSSMITAVSITLFSALDMGGVNKEEILPTLKFMQDQGVSSTTERSTSNKKRPRQENQDGDSTSSESPQDSGPFTDILQASVMASLMLPNSSMGATQTQDSVARLVSSFPSLPASNKDPWHSLVARKVKESFNIDGVRNASTGNVSWSHSVLQKYVADQQPMQQQNAPASAKVRTERNSATNHN